jgi:hypothetical protein
MQRQYVEFQAWHCMIHYILTIKREVILFCMAQKLLISLLNKLLTREKLCYEIEEACTIQMKILLVQ